MTSPPGWQGRSKQSGDPQLIRTIGAVLLVAFVVVLTVSVATIGWNGTDDYLLVMVTLVVSLLVLMAATLAAGWILSTMQPEADEDRGPSSELKRLGDRVTVELDNFRKAMKEAAESGSVDRPDRGVDS